MMHYWLKLSWHGSEMMENQTVVELRTMLVRNDEAEIGSYVAAELSWHYSPISLDAADYYLFPSPYQQL